MVKRYVPYNPLPDREASIGSTMHHHINTIRIPLDLCPFRTQIKRNAIKRGWVYCLATDRRIPNGMQHLRPSVAPHFRRGTICGVRIQ